MRSPIVAVLCILATAPLTAETANTKAAEEEGWQPLRLVLETSGAEAVCAFVIAHWYEVEGPVAHPGAPVETEFLVRPATGEIGLRNAKGERMRLERIACGASDGNRRDRINLSIEPLRAGPVGLAVACSGTPLLCQWKG